MKKNNFEFLAYETALKAIDPKWEEKLSTADLMEGQHAFMKFYAERRNQVKAKAVPITDDWPVLKDLFGEWRTQEMTILTGDSGHGKTTWGYNCGYYAMLAHKRVIYFSLEMGPMAVVEKIMRFHSGLSPIGSNLDTVFDSLFELFDTYRPVIAMAQGYLDWKKFKVLLAYACMFYKADLVIIDHLELLTTPGMDAAELGQRACQLRELAYKLDTHVLVIAHPSKIRGDGKERRIEMDELKGSSGLKQFADNVFSIFWDKQDTRMSYVKLHKIRHDQYGSNSGLEVAYTLGSSTKIFREEAR